MPIHELITTTEPKEVFSGRLWRVTAPNGAVNFMYGTAHYYEPYINTLSPELKLAIGLSDQIMFEMASERKESIHELASLLALNINLPTHPAYTLAQLESSNPECFNLLNKMLSEFLQQKDFKEELSKQLANFSFTHTVENVEQLLELEYFRQLSIYPLLYLGFIYNFSPLAKWGNERKKEELDNIIQKIAVDQNKSIVSLETETSRFEAFFILSLQEQFEFGVASLLESSLNKTNLTIEEKYQYFISKLQAKYEVFVLKYQYATNRLFGIDDANKQVYENYFDRFAFIARNQQMLMGFHDKFYAGNKLVNVGLQHYAYGFGLIPMLTNNGFKVERVYETPNVLYMYRHGWALAALSGTVTLIHPRFRKVGKMLSFSSTALTSTVSVDTINAHKPPQKSLLWASARAINAGIEEIKDEMQTILKCQSYKA